MKPENKIPVLDRISDEMKSVGEFSSRRSAAVARCR